jgi:hypothetical protein
MASDHRAGNGGGRAGRRGLAGHHPLPHPAWSDPDSKVRWVIPAAYTTAMLLGIGWALILRRTRPHTYARIGKGAKAATVAPLGLSVQPRPQSRPRVAGQSAPDRMDPWR